MKIRETDTVFEALFDVDPKLSKQAHVSFIIVPEGIHLSASDPYANVADCFLSKEAVKRLSLWLADAVKDI